MNKHLIKVIIR